MVNGEKCKTPCTTTIKRKSLNPETVTLQLEGYETRPFNLNKV